MSEGASKRVAIVLLEQEGLFLDLLQRFPARRFPVFFAATLDEALAQLRGGSPRLLLVPVGGRAREELAELFEAAQAADTQILGLAAEGEPVDDALAERLDARADPGLLDQTLEAAAGLLEERRARPRAQIAVPVTVKDIGDLTATVVSARSLFVPTETPLDGGRMVQISLESSGGVLQCWASVLRVGPGESGEPGMVLGVPERERGVRAYLDGLVRGALLLEHVEQADESAGVPDGASQQLSHRLQRDVGLLRETLRRQMTLTDALNDRLDGLVTDSARAISWADVKPLLARRLTTQQQQLKSLLERVDDLSSSRALAEELRDTLQSQHDLEERLHQQQAVITGLRQQLDELRETSATVSGPQPATVNGLSQIVHHLLARVEQLETTKTADPGARAIAEYGEQIADLSRRIDGLRDQLSIESMDSARVNALQQELQRGERELQSQLEAMDRGEWVPVPALPDLDLPPPDEEPTVPGTVIDPDGAYVERAPHDHGAVHDHAVHNHSGSPLVTGPMMVHEPEPIEIEPEPLQPEPETIEPGPPQQHPAAAAAPPNTPSETTLPPVDIEDHATESVSFGAPPDVAEPATEISVVRVSAAEALAQLEEEEETAAKPLAPASGAEGPWQRGATTSETPSAALDQASVARATTRGGYDLGDDHLDHMIVDAPPPEFEELALPRRMPWTLIFVGVVLMMVAGAAAAYLLLVDREPAPPAVAAANAAADETPGDETPANQPPADDASTPADDDATPADDDATARAGDAATPTEDAAAPTTEDAAVDAARPVKRITPAQRRRYRYLVLLSRARRALARRRHAVARRLLTQALKLSQSHTARSLLATSHAQQGERWAAIHHLNKAAAAAPARQRPRYLVRAAGHYLKLGKRTKACKRYRQALAIQPSHAGARTGLTRHCGGK